MNGESPITCGCSIHDEGMNLCGPPSKWNPNGKNHRATLARVIAVDCGSKPEDVLYMIEHEGFTREEYERERV